MKKMLTILVAITSLTAATMAVPSSAEARWGWGGGGCCWRGGWGYRGWGWGAAAVGAGLVAGAVAAPYYYGYPSVSAADFPICCR